MRVLTYDQRRYPFADVVRAIFGIEDLAHLDTALPVDLLTRATDQGTDLHRQFYTQKERLLAVYESFVRDHIASLYTEEFCYQRVPTFRVQLTNNVAVGEFHVDADYNHPDGERNYWLPLTACWGNNSLWIERHQGRGDYEAVTLRPGEFLEFDAVHLRHGNKVNDTGFARASLDFRCIPLARLPRTSARTVSYGVPLTVDGYYRIFTRDGGRVENAPSRPAESPVGREVPV
jgi:hypothetical protein